MLWSSLASVRVGALAGVGVLVLGALLMWAIDGAGKRTGGARSVQSRASR